MPRPFWCLLLLVPLLQEATTLRGAENSEVSPGMLKKFLVAVAVMVRPTATFLLGLKVKETLPEASVMTVFCPMNVLPSFCRKGWRRTGLCKGYCPAVQLGCYGGGGRGGLGRGDHGEVLQVVGA